MRVAMISEVFYGEGAGERLRRALGAAAAQDAELAVLPELPCDPWIPCVRDVSETDAEAPGGRRHDLLATAARDVGVPVLGGAIVQCDGQRYNTALLFDGVGELVHAYRKVHVPQEAGFFEQDHYAAGGDSPKRVDGFGMPLGVQICSDLNRPEGCHILGAQGVEVVVAPRATEASTFARWELVIRANALTSCCFVLSVNRPGPERGVALGGPSIAVAPDGAVLVCEAAPLVVVDLDPEQVAAARQRYPGYLAIPAGLYAEGWRSVGVR